MIKSFFQIAFILISSIGIAIGQVSIDNSLATADDEITITYDASLGTTGLVGATKVFMHAGVILDGPTSTSWMHVVGDWGDPNSLGEMTNMGNNIWQITLTPRDYFAGAGLPAEAIVYRLGLVFREAGPCGGFGGSSNSCAEGKTNSNGDFFIDLNAYSLYFASPTKDLTFVDANEQVNFDVVASQQGTILLYKNEQVIKSETNATQLTYQYTATESAVFKAVGTSNGNEFTATRQVLVRGLTENDPRPAGIIDGINYDPLDDTKATLSLLAPQKSSVYLTGDFNDWTIENQFLMKKDGEHFWLQLDNLTPNQEYGFQYLVDESIWIADPYADKILDPDDQYIPPSTYPNLKTYPEAAMRQGWYSNRVSVLQTNQEDYLWEIQDFQRPDKEDLVIYELLIRDFFGPGDQNFQNLIDTLDYLEDLGVNAIELMPIMEFNGNEGWGYNPTFMFAVDKFYGTKNDFKAFIDAAHARGIAVILDIAMNHQDIPGSYALMYFDFNNFKPAANNPWFNVTPKHPFNVFFDFNHESLYTQTYLDSINAYWLNEYQVDGFRFDLSKGFTQVNSGSNVGLWGNYDQSRVNILTRMAGKIWEESADAYIILEHFGENSEEKILANSGMMLWGNMNHVHSEIAMGYEGDSDISWGYYGSRNWNDPNLVTYMESHDEERTAFKMFEFGNSVINYSVKDLGTAMQRLKATASIFYTLPGAKMLWQFGEFGYDVSIDFNGRLAIKPTKWEYLQVNQRESLQSVVSELIKLKTSYPIFKTDDVTFTSGSSLAKTIVLRGNPYVELPTSSDQMNVVVVSNLTMGFNIQSVSFPHTGTWYSYFDEEELAVSGASTNVSLGAGFFKLYTDFKLDKPDIVLGRESYIESLYSIFPNPASNRMTVEGPFVDHLDNLVLTDMTGRRFIPPIQKTSNSTLSIDLSALDRGVYIISMPGFRERVIVK